MDEHRKRANAARTRIGRPLPNLFTPKLLTVLREGYGLADFRADMISGLTVAIVALPLSMAIAIASGVTPDRGLYTAMVGGFIVSLLGGSRFQIGGPAGAFIVLVALTAERHGVDGVILATMMAGIFLVAAGLLRLGTYIKFIPYPVTVGFTAGIAVIIFASQIKDLFGITLADEGAGRAVPKLAALAHALPTVNASALLWRRSPSRMIVVLRMLRPDWPGILIARRCRGVAGLGAGAAGGNDRHAFRRHSRNCRCRHCRRCRRKRRRRCCPMPSLSRCWQRSNRCYRRWSPMA